MSLVQALPEVKVTLVADRFGSETTSDGAAGLWEVRADFCHPPDFFLYETQKGFSLRTNVPTNVCM